MSNNELQARVDALRGKSSSHSKRPPCTHGHEHEHEHPAPHTPTENEALAALQGFKDGVEFMKGCYAEAAEEARETLRVACGCANGTTTVVEGLADSQYANFGRTGTVY